ncbi:MAG: ATP-dependent DNA ligase [Candidatus Babeliales bacterium]
MKFIEVAEVFQEIEPISGRLAMTDMLAALLKKADPAQASIIVNLAIGQLRPPFLGNQFNMAKKSLIPVVADLLDRSEETVTAHEKKLGDLGLVVQEYVWSVDKHLTVRQVYDALCAIEEIRGTGSQEVKAEKTLALLKQVDALSAKFIVRIILDKLRLGFSDMTVLDALSVMEVGDKSLRDALEHAYNISVDIGLIAQTLKEKGVKAIEQMKIQIGIPIRPAAAERLPDAESIIKKIGESIAQPKIDGFRLQIHVDTTGSIPKVEFFSRNLIDMSAMFPELKHAFEKFPAKTFICEGEAIVYHPETKTYLPFQETVKRKRKHNIDAVKEELPLKVILFDLLYLNGKSMLDESHVSRRQALEKVMEKFNDPQVELIEEKVFNDPVKLHTYFLECIDAGLEGLVVKKPDAIYRPGKRDFNWIKLKRQAGSELEDTVDCVVLGYYFGRGKRVDLGIGALLVGVYNEKEALFQTVAKVGTGLSEAAWIELRKKCDAVAVKEKPKNVVCAKELTPDVWTSPEIVIEVFADEITISPMHTAGQTKDFLGYGLRFPRFMGYRSDKKPMQATSVQEIARMFQDQRK